MSFSPPERLKSIPNEAQWLGGIGAGSWFVLIKESNKYCIQRYSSKGILECEGTFNVNDSSFNINETYAFTYLSHCSLCTVIQKNKKYKFTIDEN
tara:strand:+ start:4417 stop:4701 length:285 start_codon:yes stop_codon:yes gene_type:complete